MLKQTWESEVISAELDPVPIRPDRYGKLSAFAEVAHCNRIVVQVAHAVAGKGTILVYSSSSGNTGNTDANWSLEGTITDETPLEITTPCTMVKLESADVDGSNAISPTNFLKAKILAFKE